MAVQYIGELPMPEEGSSTDVYTHKNLVEIHLPQQLVTISSNDNIIKIHEGVKILKMDITGNNNQIHAVNFYNGFTTQIVDLNITGQKNKCHIRTTGKLGLKGSNNRHSMVATQSIDTEDNAGGNTFIPFMQTYEDS